MNTFLIVVVTVIVVGAIVADRAITKGKNVTLTVPRFLTLTATTPPSERVERNNEDERPLAQ